jgi:hypothetical protein
MRAIKSHTGEEELYKRRWITNTQQHIDIDTITHPSIHASLRKSRRATSTTLHHFSIINFCPLGLLCLACTQ